MGGSGNKEVPFTESMLESYAMPLSATEDQQCKTQFAWSAMRSNGLDLLMMGIRLLEQYYDSSTCYGRNYTASDAIGALFRNDPVHWAETGGRLWDMYDWKEKLEVTTSGGIWIRPENEAEMRIELREEQQLLPQERERLKKERRQTEEWRRKREIEKKREERVDDALYAALRTVILEKRPV